MEARRTVGFDGERAIEEDSVNVGVERQYATIPCRRE
jgi:hypothetical protein